jgi:nucleotide-binding universal stress UspA family protein
MRNIAFTTALTGEDDVAFAHAVALAVAAGAELTTIHGSEADDPPTPEALPDARPLLERWGIDAGRLTQQRTVEKVEGVLIDPLAKVLDALHQAEPELVVAATHARSGLARLLQRSGAESIALNMDVPTLLFPIDSHGFIDMSTGEIDLRRVIVPAGDPEMARIGYDAATAVVDALGESGVAFLMVQAGGDVGRRPILEPRDDCFIEWIDMPETLETAVEYVTDEQTSLLVMATRGHDSIEDVIFGTHTERVLREARCPLLWVPAKS